MEVSNLNGLIKEQPKKNKGRMIAIITNAAAFICLGVIFAPAVAMLALARGIVALGSLVLSPARPKAHQP